MRLYQCASSQPANPTGTSTYTWSSGTFSNPSGAGSWSQTPTAPSTGQSIWISELVINDVITSITSTSRDWSNAKVIQAGSTASLATYAGLADKPTSLNAIQAGAGDKLAGIEAGATVGATSNQVTAIISAQNTANAKVTTFFQASSSVPTALTVGDLWVVSDLTPKVTRRWSGSAWADMTVHPSAAVQLTDFNNNISVPIADKLTKSAVNVLTGGCTIQVGNSPTTTGGIILSTNGLAGYNTSGVATFSISTTGTAIFSGNLAGAHGSFGDLTFDAGGYIKSPSMSGHLSGYGIWFSNAAGAAGIEEVTIGKGTSGTTLVTGIAYTSTTQVTKALFNDASNWAKFGFGTYAGEFSGDVYVTGAITATGNVTAYSDRRLKKNIKKLKRSIDDLNGYSFKWRKKFDRGELAKVDDVGLIADEVEKVIPEAVFEDNNGFKTVDYSRVIPLLVEEIKSLKVRVKGLEDDFAK
jgi:hypothetical protein